MGWLQDWQARTSATNRSVEVSNSSEAEVAADSAGSDLIPRSEGEPPRAGYMPITDQNGKLWWMSKDVLARPNPNAPGLTGEQIERIRAFKEILVEQDRSSLDEAVSNFQRDEHPDREIQTWERIARVYAAELMQRPDADANERRLLFSALIACTFSATFEGVTATQPALTGLADLGRVIDRFTSAA